MKVLKQQLLQRDKGGGARFYSCSSQSSSQTKSAGSIILFSVLIMTVILTATLATISILIPKIRLSRDVANSVGAIFAADSVIEWCIYEARQGTTNQPNMSNGATYNLTPSTCPLNEIFDNIAVGNFKGVSRAFSVGGI